MDFTLIVCDDIVDNGRPIGEFGPSSSYRYLQADDPHRLVPVAQKKHQMYGKRYFHDQAHGGASGGKNDGTLTFYTS